MAQQLTRRENVQRKPTAAIIEPKIADWNSFLYHTGCKRLRLIHSFMMMLNKSWTLPLLQSYGLRGTNEMSHEYIYLTGACKICGQNHSTVTIELEHGGFIMIPANVFQELKLKKKKVQSYILSPDIFWSEEEGF